MKKIYLVGWLLWTALAAIYLGKYIRIGKKFSLEVPNLQWKIWTTKNSKINIAFPNSTLENFFKKYLPGDYQPTPRRQAQGKFLLLNGTNGWHHLTKKFIDEFYPDTNFTLVLIDAHPDATPIFETNKINCGNWINTVHQPVIFLGGSAGFDEEVNRFLNSELISQNHLKIYTARSFSFYLKSPKIPPESFRKVNFDRIAASFGFPGYYVQTYSLKDFYQKKIARQKIYVTIDLDVLSSRYVRTDFGSGLLSLEELLELLDFLNRNNTIIGIDICGITPNSDEKTRKTWQIIFTRILGYSNIFR